MTLKVALMGFIRERNGWRKGAAGRQMNICKDTVA